MSRRSASPSFSSTNAPTIQCCGLLHAASASHKHTSSQQPPLPPPQQPEAKTGERMVNGKTLAETVAEMQQRRAAGVREKAFRYRPNPFEVRFAMFSIKPDDMNKLRPPRANELASEADVEVELANRRRALQEESKQPPESKLPQAPSHVSDDANAPPVSASASAPLPPHLAAAVASGAHFLPYVVQPNDTLFGLALRFGTTEERIQQYNRRACFDYLDNVLGETLYIPTRYATLTDVPPPPGARRTGQEAMIDDFLGQARDRLRSAAATALRSSLSSKALVYDVSVEEARFYLDESGWNVAAALDAYLADLNWEQSVPTPAPGTQMQADSMSRTALLAGEHVSAAAPMVTANA